MTSASFNNSMDFSTLAPASATGASYVTAVDEAGFEALVRQSVRHPVVVELTSPRAHGSAELSKTLADIANSAGGKFLLATVNIDEQPGIAQMLQVQAVPMVVAIIGGQLAPLFQGTASREDAAMAIDQVLQVAAANGVMGTADPVGGAPSAASPEAPAVDPRFGAADQALVAGDYATAVAEFDKLLASTPGDAEVIAGRSQAALLLRSTGFDAAAVVQRASAEPNDIDAQLDAADLEIINGANEAAFDRLLGLAAELDAECRDTVRLRLLELFEVVGRTSPVVLKARRRLSGLLF